MRERRKRGWVLAVVVGLAAAALVAFPRTGSAADDYPYQGRDSSELDERGFYYQQCTSFVAWRMAQRGEFHNYMQGGHWWHARNWADNAQRLGFTVDQTPAPGAIAHWYAGEGGAKDLGHVAFVESVNADGSVIVEEYNGLNPYAYGRRGPIRAPRYLHVYDDGPPVISTEPEPVVEEDQEDQEPVAPIVSRTAEVTVPQTEPKDRAPTGHLSAPAERLIAGATVTLTGEFEDDSGVTKVHFFVADQSYRWKHIGTDARGGNGTYSVPWKVDYPAGSRISLYAEAFDDAGNQAVDSVRGLEDLPVDGSEEPVGSSEGVGPESEERLTGVLSGAQTRGLPATAAPILIAAILACGLVPALRRVSRRRSAVEPNVDAPR